MAARSPMPERWSRESSIAIDAALPGATCPGVRAVADDLDLASTPGQRRHLGPHPRTTAHHRRRCGDTGLGGLGGLDDRPCASARHQHRPPHRGTHRITRICESNRLTTPSAVPEAVCRQRSINSSTVTDCRWSCSSRRDNSAIRLPSRICSTNCESPVWPVDVRAPGRTGSAVTRHTPRAPTVRCCGGAASARSSPNRPIRPDIVADADQVVADRRHSIRLTIAAAMWLNAGSAISSSGVDWPRDMTNSRPSTALP